MRGIMTVKKRTALWLFCVLLGAALLLGAFSSPAFSARAAEPQGSINEDFETITEIPKAKPWILPPTATDTFFSPIAGAYGLSDLTGIVADPAEEVTEGEEASNHVLRMGVGGGASTSCQDVFATRSVTGFSEGLTVSLSFYFDSVLKSGDYFAQMFFGEGGAANFGAGNPAMPYRIWAAGGKNVLNSTGVLDFPDVELPLRQWFTITLSVDVATVNADLYWSTADPDTGNTVYRLLLHDFQLKTTWATAVQKGFGYMRFGSLAMKYDANNPTVYYLDNLYVQPTYEPYVSKLPADEAFRFTHAYALALTEENLKLGDGAKIDAALAAFEALSEDAKTELSEEKSKLDALKEAHENNFTGANLYRRDHAVILSRTTDGADETALLRSDYARIEAALAAFDALEEAYQAKLAEEHTLLLALQTAYAERYPFEVREDFQTYDVDSALPYDADAESTDFAYPYASLYESASGSVVIDPQNAENKVYKMSGADGGIVSRKFARDLREKFTIRTKFYFPRLLAENESVRLNVGFTNTSGAPATRCAFGIKAENDRLVLVRGDIGSSASFPIKEVPVAAWFEVIAEADFLAGRIDLYLLSGESAPAYVGAAEITADNLGRGLTQYTVMPAFAAAGEAESASECYIDDLCAVDEFYLSAAEIAEKNEAEVTALENYAKAFEGEYLATETVNELLENLSSGAYAEENDVINPCFTTEIVSLARIQRRMDLFRGVVNAALYEKLAAYADGLKSEEGVYSDAGKQAITDALAANDIDNAAVRGTYAHDAAVAAVKAAYDAAKDAIDAVPDAVNELADAKTQAKAELDAYDADAYRDAQKTELADAVASGKAAIDAADSAAGVQSALQAAKTVIGAIKTDAQLTAEEEAAAAFAKLKADAKAELAAYKNESDYRDAQKEELRSALSDGNAAIDAATDSEEIDAAVALAKTAMDAIKTDAEFTAEEEAAAAFAKLKADAKAELAAYKNESEYRNAQKAELSREIANGKAAIDAATTEKEVENALRLGKAKIDLIKTDAQLTAEGVENEDDKPAPGPDDGDDDGTEKKKSCGGNVAASGWALAALALSGAAILSACRRGKQKNEAV